jgi:hypothetical protein
MAGFYVDRGLSSTRLFEDRGMVTNDSNAYVITETVPSVVPAITAVEVNIPTTRTVNIQTIVQGFGGYLDGILPPDIATSAGAFSASMQQIKNISSIPVEKFAQVVTSLETTKGLNVNGSNVPTDTTLAQQGLNLIALGNGPYGTYTMSNFLGCMSGLPYLGINVRQLIQQLETPTLYNIYRNLYLAVTWEAATVSVQYITTSDEFNTYYTVTGVTLTEPGGGYGINGASAPTITIVNGGGATATAIIGTNYSDLGSNGAGNYGRVTSIQTSLSGSPSTSVPYVTIQTPPITYGSSTNQSSGTSGWPGMNTAIQLYIDAANAEIVVIKNSQPAKAQKLITNWELTGTLLSIEQRAIATGLPIKVPLANPSVDREPTLAGYPTTQYSFVDSIPRYAKFTQPHMYSQTIEAISNLNLVGGRSIVGMLRQARNQDRLTELGIPLDNNIENKLTDKEEAQLIANGTLPNSVPSTSGTLTPNSITGYSDSLPATLETVLPGITLNTSVPYPASLIVNAGSFAVGSTYIINTVGTTDFTLIGATSNTIGDSFIATGAGTGTGTAVILTGLDPVVVSPDPYGYYDPTTNEYFTTNRAYQGTGITADTLNSFNGSLGGLGGSTGSGIPTGFNAISGIGSLLDTGQAIEPGSFAGSSYQNLISPQLSSIYTSRGLLPSTYTIQEAIDEVIRCNCDCWDSV